MMQLSELRRTPSPGEEVFSWQCPETGKIRIWAVERLRAWLESSGHPVLKAALSPDRARWYFDNRGVEKHRVERLINAPEQLIKPAIMLRLTQPLNDVMLDGHHRYVVLALAGMPEFLLYSVTEAQAAPFEVEPPSMPPGTVLDPSRPSGF